MKQLPRNLCWTLLKNEASCRSPQGGELNVFGDCESEGTYRKRLPEELIQLLGSLGSSTTSDTLELNL